MSRMYLDQVPMSRRNVSEIVREAFVEKMNDYDHDDPIVDVSENPVRVRIVTETGCVFDITITKLAGD